MTVRRDIGTHLAEMNRSVTGYTACLPDTFGMKAKDLAGLMNAYQAAAVERAWQRHAKDVAEFRATVTDSMAKAGTPVDVITDPSQMNLPEDMAPWPSVLVVAKKPRPDGSRHVLIAADILSPISKWLPEMDKEADAFKHLQADELQFIDADKKDVRRVMPDAAT